MFFHLDFMNIIGFFASVLVFARGGELAAAAAAPQPAQLLMLTGNNNFSTIGHHRSLQQQSTKEMCLRIEQNFKDVFWTHADPDYIYCECDGKTNKGTCTLIFPEVCEEKACVGNNDKNDNNYTKEEGQYRCVNASATSVKLCVVNKFKIFVTFDQSGWKETNRVRQNFVTSGVQNIQLYEESYSYNTVNGYPVECGVSYDGVACQTCQVCDYSMHGNYGKLQKEFPWTVDCSNIDDYFIPFTCALARNVKLTDDLMVLNASVTNELPLDFIVPSTYSSSGRPSSFGTVVFPFVFAAATTTVAVVLPFFGVE